MGLLFTFNGMYVRTGPKQATKPTSGMSVRRSLKKAQNTKKAALMARNTGKVRPSVAINGWLAGLSLSLYPTASITKMVATLAPLAS